MTKGRIHRTRVVIRYYACDGRRHVYFAWHFASHSGHQIHPVCHAEPLRSDRAHRTDMFTGVWFPDLGGPHYGCRGCGLWLRRTTHEVLQDNGIVAEHDILPTQRSLRQRVRKKAKDLMGN